MIIPLNPESNFGQYPNEKGHNGLHRLKNMSLKKIFSEVSLNAALKKEGRGKILGKFSQVKDPRSKLTAQEDEPLEPEFLEKFEIQKQQGNETPKKSQSKRTVKSKLK